MGHQHIDMHIALMFIIDLFEFFQVKPIVFFHIENGLTVIATDNHMLKFCAQRTDTLVVIYIAKGQVLFFCHTIKDLSLCTFTVPCADESVSQQTATSLQKVARLMVKAQQKPE